MFAGRLLDHANTPLSLLAYGIVKIELEQTLNFPELAIPEENA